MVGVGDFDLPVSRRHSKELRDRLVRHARRDIAVTVDEPPRRQVIRAVPRRPSDRSLSPVTDDLYQPDAYGRELLTSLMRAQAGVSLAVLVPAISLLALYPLLAVLLPGLASYEVLGLPLTLIILGGGIYPPLVLLGYWYVRRAERLEQRFVELLEGTVTEPATIAAIVAVTVVTAVISVRGVRIARTPADFMVAARSGTVVPQRLRHLGRVPVRRVVPGHCRTGHARRARRPLVRGRLRRRLPGAPGRRGRATAALRRLHDSRLRRGPAGVPAAPPCRHRHRPRHLRLLPLAAAQGGGADPAGGLRGPRVDRGRRPRRHRDVGHRQRRDEGHHLRAGLPVLAQDHRTGHSRPSSS